MKTFKEFIESNEYQRIKEKEQHELVLSDGIIDDGFVVEGLLTTVLGSGYLVKLRNNIKKSNNINLIGIELLKAIATVGGVLLKEVSEIKKSLKK